MKALTIRQPWASLIVTGAKDIENRSWKTSYRGPLLIHAGMKFEQEGLDSILLDVRRAVDVYMSRPRQEIQLPRGAIIGTVDLVDIVRDSASPWAEPDQFHWVLANAREMTPEPARGMLGLWEHGPRAQLCLNLDT